MLLALEESLLVKIARLQCMLEPVNYEIAIRLERTDGDANLFELY